MGNQIIKLNDKDSEVDEIILFSTPILYGFICGVGSFNHDLLLRPDEVLSGILDAPVLEVTHDAFRILFQHHHMSTGCVA
jgi:hypothetical protein